MPNPSKDRVSFHLEAESAPDFRAVEDEPFRIALLGDFSGRSQRPPIGARKPIPIDRDNFDEVIEGLGVGVDLPGGRLSIGSLDHFHPDHIYGRHPAFKDLGQNRARLDNPETFPEAARELLGEKTAPVPIPPGGLLNWIAGESDSSAASAPARDDLQDFINDAMRSSLVARQDPRAPHMIRRVDEVASSLMRAILNNGSFKAIEAAWRTVYYLVRRLETGPDLKIYLIDLTQAELAADIEAVAQLLLQRSEPWAVLAGNYSFGTDDLKVLGWMAKIAAKAQAPFLAEADGSLLGSDPQWEAFRQTVEAKHIGLALPRVLVRTPYGKNSSPCEEFAFEEIDGTPEAKQMLFGSPAFYAAMLIGEAFASDGWSLRPGSVREISDLPVYTYKEDGGSKAFPCAEVELTPEIAEALVERGLMPLAAIDSDVVRVVRFQSVAATPAALAGKWQ